MEGIQRQITQMDYNLFYSINGLGLASTALEDAILTLVAENSFVLQ